MTSKTKATMHGGDHWGRDARGQSTVFVACMLFVLLLFVGAVANVGQAVNRRIALQIVADTGAYTGASVMATGLNQLAFWNTTLQYTWAIFTAPGSPVYLPFQFQRIGLPYLPLARCDRIGGWISFWTSVRTAINLVYVVENVGYGLLASSEAHNVSDFNAADLFPGEELRYAEADSVSDMLRDPLGAIPPARNPLRLDDSPRVPDGTFVKAIAGLRDIPVLPYALVPAQRTLRYSCTVQVPPYVVGPLQRNFVTWYRHSNFDTSFVWLVKASATRALMFDRFFGGNTIPEMKAAAVAKPTGGSLEEGRRKYVVKLMPVASVMAGRRLFNSFLPDWLRDVLPANAGWISDERSDRGWRIVTH